MIYVFDLLHGTGYIDTFFENKLSSGETKKTTIKKFIKKISVYKIITEKLFTGDHLFEAFSYIYTLSRRNNYIVSYLSCLVSIFGSHMHQTHTTAT